MSQLKLYLYGVLINLIVLFVLTRTEDKVRWELTDSGEYREYATSFVATGTFGDRNLYNKNYHIRSTDYYPGVRRTIGYPFLLSIFMWIFGNDWLLPLQIFNCFLYALLYPLLMGIYYELFGHRRDKAIFWVLLLLGIPFARVTQVLTDTTFAVVLFGAVYVGLLSYKRNKWWLYVLYMVLIFYACTIRLTGVLIPVLNVVLWWITGVKRVFPVLITMIVVLFAAQFNTIRNYVNHRKAIDSTIPEVSMRDYLCKEVNGYVYILPKDFPNREKHIQRYVWNTVTNNPIKTVKVLLKNCKNVFLDSHPVNNIANHYGFNWKDFKDFKKHNLVGLLYIMYAFMYVLFWTVLLFVLYTLILNKEWAYLGLFAVFAAMCLAPGVVIGTGGSRLRLGFELLAIIFIVKPVSK